MKRSRCRSCNAEIIWASTENCKLIPVDSEPCKNGNIELKEVSFDRPWATVHGQPTLFSVPLYVSHFVTCPQADTHRKD